MFFSSHVTGQSHNPARGRRLALKYNDIQNGKNLPHQKNTTQRSRFHKSNYQPYIKVFYIEKFLL